MLMCVYPDGYNCTFMELKYMKASEQKVTNAL